MALIVHPDPQNPTGGFGFLELPAGSLPDGSVTVAVQDVYSDRWLNPSNETEIAIGDPNWQPERHGFGPYDVLRHDGADWVRIGPEIVNKIEEYTPLRIEVNGMVHDITWPDDVPPRAGTAALGGLRTAPPPAPEPVPETPRPPPEPMPEIVVPDPVDPPEPADVQAPSRTRGLVWVVAMLLLAAAAGAAAWVLLDWPEQTAEEPQPPGQEVPVAARTGCTLTALQQKPGFDAQIAAVRDCGAEVSPDIALRLIEDAAAAGDGQALLLFATLYDGDRLAPRIENLIGLSFADDPARAAEYYARAAQAGAGDAASLLAAICARLAGSELTLERGAYDDFCN